MGVSLFVQGTPKWPQTFPKFTFINEFPSILVSFTLTMLSFAMIPDEARLVLGKYTSNFELKLRILQIIQRKFQVFE